MSNYNQLKITYSGGSQTAITLTNNYIDGGEYQNKNIVAVEVPEIVEEIQSYAFADNRRLAYIKLNEGVTNIGAQAFQHGEYSAVTIPSTVTYIGWNAFNISYEQMGDLYLTITCLALAPPTLNDPEGITFGNKEFLTIKVPDASVNDYKSSWPQYADVIEGGAQPEPEPTSGSSFTTKDIAAAYMGTDSVAKIYLGSEEVWAASQPEPVYSAMPLTFEILSDGDIKWVAYGSSPQYKLIEYSINGGNHVAITSNTGSSAPSISVQTGDIVQFWGNNTTYATNTSTYSTFRGSTCGFKIKGNIMSLIDSTGFTTATTMYTSYTFYSLFRQITGLTDASNLVLPATTLARSCYQNMFMECSSLTTAPELPATTLAQGCYNSMFQGCRSLTTAPVLPATTLAQRCYYYMFQGCIHLTTAPELPATVSEQMCYNGMFSTCTALTTAPSELPITTLKGGEYNGMFDGCTSLQKSPKILATNIVGNSAAGMFNNCSNLNEVYCLATAIAQYSTSWLTGVSATGTFYKDPNATIWTPGQNGIPEGWTVQNADI